MHTPVHDGQGLELLDLAALAALALKAGEAVLEVYAAGCTATTKPDASPVTEADLRAEAVILDGLARLAPGIPVIAEEECAAGRTPDAGETFFLVDPVDGTREFLARNGEFTVNIALVRGGVPVAGVVYAPALGMLYAGAGTRAFKAAVQGHRTDVPETISVRPAPAAPVAVGSRSHGAVETAQWLSRFPGVSFVSAGSSLKFCLLAEGAADLYPRFGRTMEWDTAAGDAVLRAAGGGVVTLDGAPLAYGKRGQDRDVDYANPHFIAYGDGRLLAEAAAPRRE